MPRLLFPLTALCLALAACQPQIPDSGDPVVTGALGGTPSGGVGVPSESNLPPEVLRNLPPGTDTRSVRLNRGCWQVGGTPVTDPAGAPVCL